MSSHAAFLKASGDSGRDRARLNRRLAICACSTASLHLTPALSARLRLQSAIVQRTLDGIFIGYFAAATAGPLGGPGRRWWKGARVLDAYGAPAMTDPEIERVRRRYGR